MPGPVLEAREAGINKQTRQGPCFHEAYILTGQHIINVVNKSTRLILFFTLSVLIKDYNGVIFRSDGKLSLRR